MLGSSYRLKVPVLALEKATKRLEGLFAPEMDFVPYKYCNVTLEGGFKGFFEYIF
jgi:hypothetical protein